MNQILLILIGIAVLVTAGFTIALIVEVRKTICILNKLLKTTEECIKPTLEEMQLTLKSLRRVSDDLNDVTADIKTLSGAARDVGRNIRHISNLVESVTLATAIKASGLKAGIKTGLEVLLGNLFSRIGGGK